MKEPCKVWVHCRGKDCDLPGKWFEIDAWPIKLRGFEQIRLVVHPQLIRTRGRKGFTLSDEWWTVTEVTTGLRCADGLGRVAAVREARRQLRKAGLERILDSIARDSQIKGTREAAAVDAALGVGPASLREEG